MKVAVMTDVHGNLPALEVALEVIKSENCDYIYHTGDAIAVGPFPLECLEMLLANNVRMLMGNHAQWTTHHQRRPHRSKSPRRLPHRPSTHSSASHSPQWIIHQGLPRKLELPRPLVHISREN